LEGDTAGIQQANKTVQYVASSSVAPETLTALAQMHCHKPPSAQRLLARQINTSCTMQLCVVAAMPAAAADLE
jgi:hypothetical protein